MRKQFKTLSALMLSAVLAVSALPFSKVEAKSKWVEINGVNYEINRITGECEASLNVKKGKSEVRIPNKVKYQGDIYKVTFFSWDDWDQDWKEETNRSYKPAAGSYQAVLEKITIAKGVRVSEPACHYQKLKKIVFEEPAGVSGTEFYDCPQLQSLYIPKKVKYWPTVRKCPKVKITISSSNPYLKVINNDIYSKNGKTLYSVASTKANLSLGTVYRNLTLLSDMGEILRLRVGDGVDHFDADTSEHYHFVCTECGSVIDLDMDSIDSIMEAAGERFDGRIRGHVTYFYGSCPACTRVATES